MDDSEFALEAVSEGGVDIFGDLGVGDAWREVDGMLGCDWIKSCK